MKKLITVGTWFCLCLVCAIYGHETEAVPRGDGTADREEVTLKYGISDIIIPAPANPRYQHLSWPKIVKTADGTLVVAYIAGRKHVNGEGCPAVSISADGGKTFSQPNILMNFDKSTTFRHCANLAMGIAPDGAVLLMGMAFTDNLRNNIYCWRSEDSGRSWALTDTAALGDSQTGSVFGHVFEVPGRGVAVCGHYRKPKGDGIWIAYSEDQGRTWDPARTITTEKYFEPAFIFAGRSLIGLVREDSAHAYHQFTSDDMGEAWSFRSKAIQGDPHSHHPSPFVVEDTTEPGIFYSLQTERSQAREIYLWTARRDEMKWKKIRRVAAAPNKEDFGYPWMTHIEGNAWFLVYYAGESDGPNDIYGMRLRISPLENKVTQSP